MDNTNKNIKPDSELFTNSPNGDQSRNYLPTCLKQNGQCKLNNKNIINRQVKFIDDLHISKQSNESKLQMIPRTSHEISKTQAKKGREKLSKNNFRYTPDGKEHTHQYEKCHTFCKEETTLFTMRIYRRVLHSVWKVCKDYENETAIYDESNTKEIEVCNRYNSLYDSHLDSYEYPIENRKNVEDYFNVYTCLNDIVVEYEQIRKVFLEDCMYLDDCSPLKKKLNIYRQELEKIKIQTMAGIVRHTRMKGIPVTKYVKWAEEEKKENTRKHYHRMLKEVFYSLKIRWEENSITKHPILSQKFPTVQAEIFNRPLDKVFEAIQELEKSIKSEPNKRTDWHLPKVIVPHTDVYDRVRNVFTKEEMLRADRRLVSYVSKRPSLIPFGCVILHIIALILGISTTYVFIGYCAVLTRLFVYLMFDYLANNIEQLIMTIAKRIGIGMANIGKSVQSKSGIFDALVNGFNRHKAGLSACMYDITQAEDTSRVISEVVKVGSMLELETSITSSVLGRLTRNTGELLVNEADRMTQHVNFEKILPALSVAMGLTGKSLTGLRFDQNINMIAMNLKHSQFLYKSICDVLKECGLMKDSVSELITGITTKLTDIRSDYEWILRCLATSGNEFLKPEGMVRYKKFKETVEDLTIQMREIERSKFDRTQIVTEANSLLIEIRRNIDAVEIVLKRMPRVIPVGICLWGESHVGKTSLSNEIHRRICHRAVELHPNLFPDAKNWTKWNAQARDEYDQNYLGDEIMYEDDAFAEKDDNGHLKYLSFISSGAVSTVQADLKAKGRPFTAKVVMVSCNNLPVKSGSINNIEAIWNRFPLTVECTVKYGSSIKTSRDQYDKDFNHLDFYVAPMYNFARAGTKRGAGPVNKTKITLSELIDRIVNEMALQQEKLDQTLLCYEVNREEPITQHDDEDIINVNPVAKEITVPRTLTLFRQMRKALEEDTESILNFRAWAKHLKRKNTGEKWSDYALTDNPMSAYEFLVSLGIWEWIEGEEEEGKKALACQMPVVVSCPYSTRYMWCPVLTLNELMVVTDRVETAIKNDNYFKMVVERFAHKFLEAGSNDMELIRNTLFQFWNEYLGQDRMARITSIVISASLLGSRHILVQYFIHIEEALLTTTHIRVQARRLLNNGPSLISASLRLFNWDNEIITTLFDKIGAFVKNVKDTVYSMLLKLFEFIGVDIGPYLNGFCDFVASVGHQTVCLAIVSMILYAIYKLFKILTEKKKKPIKQHNRVYEGREKKNTSRKSQKKIELHIEECLEECDVIQTKMLEKDWKVYDEHCDFDSMEWLENVLTVSKEDARIGYFGHSDCKDYYFTEPIDWSGNEQRQENNTIMYSHFDTNPVNEDRVPQIALVVKSDLNGKTSLDLSFLKSLNVLDYYIAVRKQLDVDCIRAYIEIYLLNGTSQGEKCLIRRKQFSSVMTPIFRQKNEEPQSWCEKMIAKTVDTHSSTEANEFLNRMRKDHVVSVAVTSLLEADNKKIRNCYGVGHKNMIVTVGHLFYDGETLVKVWSKDPDDYHIAKLIHTDMQGDRAFLKILSYREVKNLTYVDNCKLISRVEKVFPNLEKHLFTHNEFVSQCDNIPVMMWTHNQEALMCTTMQFRSPVYNDYADGVNRKVQYYALYGFKVDDAYKRNGECGSMIASAKIGTPPRWVGFYAASAGREHFCSTIWREQLQLAETFIKPQLVTHVARVEDIPCMEKEDVWLELCMDGKQVDTPTGPEVDFVGKYCESTKPISKNTIKHWRLSPFNAEFEERLQPAPLSASDSRIEVELPRNLDGKPSLLAVLNGTVSLPLPENDDELLEFCANQMENEYFNLLNIQDTPESLEDLLTQALNGHPNNEYVTGIEVNKAAGLPFATFGAQMKSDMINVDPTTGFRSIKDNKLGKMLKSRIRYKLNKASKGVRVVSFSNAKLKDASIKLDYVKIGRGRIYHSIALDKVLCDMALFGNFKEAYTQAKLLVDSALTLNPHSMTVVSLVEHLKKFKYFTDADFTNFDQRLARNLILRVGLIQCNIILRKNPRDVWDTARKILIMEQVDTLVVEYQDITLTHRGNKSGEFKTTIDNNMVRELADYYCWCKIMLKHLGSNFTLAILNLISLQIYRSNRSAIGFGDDEVEAVSEEIVDLYNFETKKVELENMGMVVTPGNKSKVILKTTPFDELAFLKRKFVYQHGMWTMPLDLRSLEAPFVWTKIQDHDLDIWHELVKDRLFEAVIHGVDYFNNFKSKLEKCTDTRLLRRIAPLLSQTYDIVLSQYIKNYYEH
jgi:hypothetical protein